jgi:hypothetical protein
VTFKGEELAQVPQEPLPVPPKPAQFVEATVVVAPIAEPEAAKPRKAGAAKGKVRSAGAKRQEPRAVVAKAKDSKVKS